MQKDGASEDQLAKVRMTPADKKKIVDEFAAKTRSQEKKVGQIEEENVSVNPDTDVDTAPLLTGDADEELRMQERLAEKANNAREGKMPRVTPEDIRPSQRQPAPPQPAGASQLIQEESKNAAEERKMSFGSSNSASGRKTPKLNAASPNFQKFDAGLKK